MKKSPFSGKKVQVLLLKPLVGKGNAGDLIEVKTHYALYVLIPNGIAVVYDTQVQNQKSTQMKRIEKIKEAEQAHVKTMLSTIETNGGIIFEKAATEEEKLYDSITGRSLLAYLSKEYKVTLQPSNLDIKKIEALGEYVLNFNYQDIKHDIPVKVIRKTEKEVETEVA